MNQLQQVNIGHEKETTHNAQEIPTAGSGMGPIYSLMAARMLELIAAVNASSKAHQWDMKQIAESPSSQQQIGIWGHDLGRIKITPNDFCINLSCSCQVPFNTEAIHVFAKDFKRKVEESKWYSFPTLPPAHFLQLEYIKLSLYLHPHYVNNVYTNLKKLEETCSQGVSSDKSDMDSNRHRVYLIIPPAWHSKELANLMHTIDSTIVSNYQPRVGHRSVHGQEPGTEYPVTSSMRMWWHPWDCHSTATREVG
ncbi:hypothetical protein BKA82DRAFT_4009982 [Pisolithus tinctorius]|nr:hypothetical protein BKA82DRAFT_4009982 [Pisolithus tinctorius]